MTKLTLRNRDFPNADLNKVFDRFLTNAVGFEPIFKLFEDTGTVMDPHGYPPYNIESIDDDTYRISIAVAGFDPEEISITEQDGMLTIEGVQNNNDEDAERKYLHKGIAGRSFRRQFKLAEYIDVVAADYKNGILNIDLRRDEPETSVRTITINHG